MSLASTIVLYLMLGAGVTSGLFVREGLQTSAGAFRLALAWVFWPLYVPVLLAPVRPSAETPAGGDIGRNVTPNPILQEIARVELELAGALRTLDRWAEGALGAEEVRFTELKNAWRVQAHRIHVLGELLESFGDEAAAATAEDLPATVVSHSQQARRENIDRLRQLHRRMYDDLLGNLAWVRELVTLIHLAKYTGAPASRAEELVAQIAAAVEGLTEVSDWRSDEGAVTAA